MKTTKQIKAEATKLEKMKPRVRHYTLFGDNNHAAIEAQIAVLETKMDESGIEDRADPDITAEEELWTEHQKESALYARYWINGTEAESPSKSWSGLVS